MSKVDICGQKRGVSGPHDMFISHLAQQKVERQVVALLQPTRLADSLTWGYFSDKCPETLGTSPSVVVVNQNHDAFLTLTKW